MCVSQCPYIFLYASRIIKCSKIFFWHLVSFSLFPSLALSLSLFIMLFFLNQIPTLMNDNLCEYVQKNKVLLNPETGTTTTTTTTKGQQQQWKHPTKSTIISFIRVSFVVTEAWSLVFCSFSSCKFLEH